MKYDYKIFIDASADILPDFAVHYDIGIIPMVYTIDEEEHLCDHVETQEERKRFYQAQREGRLTKTSQTSPQMCMDAFREYASQGISVLCISLSSGLSGSFSSAGMAAEELMEEYPNVSIVCVDSLAASAGIGLLAERAALNREKGMSLSENAVDLNEMRMRLQHWFMVDDLMYLRRGGRLSAASAVIGTALSIKPILKIESDGKLVNFAKKRTAKMAMSALLSFYNESADRSGDEHVFIVHSDNPEGAEFLKSEVASVSPDSRIDIVQLSPIIAAHTGPGLCAVIHFSREEAKRG